MHTRVNDYLNWYYDTGVWANTTYMGVSCRKLVTDLWSYQEILCKLRPSIVFEAGIFQGGSTLFFAHTLERITSKCKVLGVDLSLSQVHPLVIANPNIELMACSSIDKCVSNRLKSLRIEFPGPIFAILDSDHHKPHVLAELLMLRDILHQGDYLVVEDTIIGHPILTGFGPGPFEALEDYFKMHPNDYRRDQEREDKFGMTIAPSGFLIRL